MIRASRWMTVALAVASASGVAQGQTTERVSIDSAGVQVTYGGCAPSISADGRFVAFWSQDANLVAGDTNGTYDVFVRDRLNGTTERVSVDSGGAEGNDYSNEPSISADGRFVAFRSAASNLVAGDTNGRADVFVHDRQSGMTERVSVNSGGVQGYFNDSYRPSISADGRVVAFESGAANLVAGDTNNAVDIFVHDRLSGTTERVSVGPGGAQANLGSSGPSISADGRFVAFYSGASNLVAGDTNNAVDSFVHDRQSGTTERVSVGPGGVQGNGGSYVPSISANGRFVAFASAADNLVPGDTNNDYDVFVHDRQIGTTERVSVDSGGAQGNVQSNYPSISADARSVAFLGWASNLVAGDTNGTSDVFVHDRQSGTTERVSVDSGGAQGNGNGYSSSISADGRFVAFDSSASNLVAGDTNGWVDVFVRDRGSMIPGTDLCQPGTVGAIACPCSNPPANAPRGCDNSAATGGAQLTSSGLASLAFDSVVFTTNGERPSATSVVLQGNAVFTNGVAFGQGVRCVGGVLKRLYVKTASGGSIRAPQPTDPSVSARSDALGDPITAGTNRWYAVYYRDPIVLGGCPAASTFNVTQTQLVGWGN